MIDSKKMCCGRKELPICGDGRKSICLLNLRGRREGGALTFPAGAKDANNDLSLTFEMVKENIDG